MGFNKDTPYQTLGEFLNSPFGLSDINQEKYLKQYETMVQRKQIFCENWTEMDKTYLIHIKVGSESQPGLYYDVIIQFFTDNPEYEKSNSLSRYYIQFFSNSPSFIYKYAALYRVHGYLIDSLYSKLDPEFFDHLPDVSNPKYEMSYDKSVFLACKFIKENEFTIMRKTGLKFFKKVRFNRFINSIKEFKDVTMDSEIYRMEKSLKKESDKQKEEAKEARAKVLQSLNPFHRSSGKSKKISAKTNTLMDNGDKGIQVIKKKGSNTSTSSNRSIHTVSKKKPSIRTKKR